MKFAVKTDRGIIRDTNEDSYNVMAGYSGIPVSFIIADGMGGHNSGEIASKLAVDSISNYLLQFPQMFSDDQSIPDSLKASIEKANELVYMESTKLESNFGMGTTLTVAIVLNKKIYIGHVGDSRAFLIRNDEIIHLTTDHTYIEELIRNGSITREEAANHPKRNVLMRAIGCEQNIIVDTYVYDIQNSDVFLLCTDGLTNMLSDGEIFNIVKKCEDPEHVCSELVEAAIRAGGEDNVTVIAFKNE